MVSYFYLPQPTPRSVVVRNEKARHISPSLPTASPLEVIMNRRTRPTPRHLAARNNRMAHQNGIALLPEMLVKHPVLYTLEGREMEEMSRWNGSAMGTRKLSNICTTWKAPLNSMLMRFDISTRQCQQKVQKGTCLTDGVFCTWLSVRTLRCEIDNTPPVHHIGAGKWAVGAGWVKPTIVFYKFVSFPHKFQPPLEM